MNNDRKYWENPNWSEWRNPNFYQMRWLDRLREKIAIKLAPWAIHDDLLDWYKRK
ncbi:MAG TPA: hypothetical protein VIH04_06515 [Nitrosarchaeum sp.]